MKQNIFKKMDDQPKSTIKSTSSNTNLCTWMLIGSTIHFGYHKGINAT